MRPLLTLLAVALLVGSDKPRVEDAVEVTPAGPWRVVSRQVPGGEVEAVDEKVVLPGDLVSSGEHAVFHFYPRCHPKAIEWTMTDGLYKGATYHGIYKMQGDTLVLCLDLGKESRRPTEFAAPSGLVIYIYTLKRR